MADAAPIPMLLWCPLCGHRHIDRGAFATRPHHTHACQHCGHVWRPAIVETVGVAFLPGFRDPAEVPQANGLGKKPTTRQLLAALAQHYPDGATIAEICALAHWRPASIGPLHRLVRSGRIEEVGDDRYQVKDA
jgi:hypothetical protein